MFMFGNINSIQIFGEECQEFAICKIGTTMTQCNMKGITLFWGSLDWYENKDCTMENKDNTCCQFFFCSADKFPNFLVLIMVITVTSWSSWTYVRNIALNNRDTQGIKNNLIFFIQIISKTNIAFGLPNKRAHFHLLTTLDGFTCFSSSFTGISSDGFTYPCI